MTLSSAGECIEYVHNTYYSPHAQSWPCIYQDCLNYIALLCGIRACHAWLIVEYYRRPVDITRPTSDKAQSSQIRIPSKSMPAVMILHAAFLQFSGAGGHGMVHLLPAYWCYYRLMASGCHVIPMICITHVHAMHAFYTTAAFDT